MPKKMDKQRQAVKKIIRIQGNQSKYIKIGIKRISNLMQNDQCNQTMPCEGRKYRRGAKRREGQTNQLVPVRWK